MQASPVYSHQHNVCVCIARSILPNRLEVTSTTRDCIMEGSEHVQQMGLHERYNLDVRIVLTWKEGAGISPVMETDGSIMVEV